MPQMSPMNWTLLLVFILIIMYFYISFMYFSPMINRYNHPSKSMTLPKTKKLNFKY